MFGWPAGFRVLNGLEDGLLKPWVTTAAQKVVPISFVEPTSFVVSLRASFLWKACNDLFCWLAGSTMFLLGYL